MKRLFDSFMTDQRGAVTVIVAVLVVVLFGFTALAVDVARLYQERRELTRTADLSALSGVQELWRDDDGAAARALAEEYVGENPTVNHPGSYNPEGGDLVETKVPPGDGCEYDGDLYDCIESTVVAPQFEFLFASVFGHTEQSVAATGSAFIGSGAAGGYLVAPWMVIDCPNPDRYPDEAGNTDNASCPYVFSDDWDGGTRLVLRNPQSSGTNFNGIRFRGEADGCPAPDAYIVGDTGSNPYREFLDGEFTPSRIPCAFAPGARFKRQPGNIVGPTAEALGRRRIHYEQNQIHGTAPCMNKPAFENAFTKTGDGDGFVSLVNPNPCVMIVAFTAHVNYDAQGLIDANVSGDVAQMQKQESTGRLAGFGSTGLGSDEIHIVRRLAFFYLTHIETQGANTNYHGLMLRAIFNDAVLAGPLDRASGVFVTGLLP